MFTSVRRSIIPNCPKVEAAQIPTNGCVNEHSAVYPRTRNTWQWEEREGLTLYNADGNAAFSLLDGS